MVDKRIARVLAGEKLHDVLRHKGSRLKIRSSSRRRGCGLWLWDVKKHNLAKKSFAEFWGEDQK